MKQMIDTTKLISPSYHQKVINKSWCFLRLGLDYTKFKKVKLFREIAYLNERNEVIGLGRSWIPFTLWGIKAFLILFIQRIPLGVYLSRKFPFEDLTISLIEENVSDGILMPFKTNFTQIQIAKRKITIKNLNQEIYVEEDFIC